MNLLNKYHVSISWLLIERISRVIAGIIIVAVIARYLGVDNFGKLSYIQSFVALFVTLATLGMDGLVVKELATKPGNYKIILATAFILRLIGSALMIALIALIVVFLSRDELYDLIIIASLSSIFQAFFVFDYYFQAHAFGRITAKIKLIALAVSSILKISVVYMDMGLEMLVYIIVIEAAIIGLLMLAKYTSLEKKVSLLNFDWAIGKDLLIKGWPLILSGFVMAIYMKIDQIMLHWMLQSSDVGVYAAAVKIAEGVNFLPVIICSSLFPWVLAAKKSKKLFEDRLISLHSLMIWLALSVIVALTIGGHYIIDFLYGEDFSGSADVLLLYTWASLIVYVNVSSTLWIISQNMQKYKLIMDVTGAILNILLNLYFIPKYGPYGAALATVVSYSLTFFLAYGAISPVRKNLKYVFLAVIRPKTILKIGH